MALSLVLVATYRQPHEPGQVGQCDDDEDDEQEASKDQHDLQTQTETPQQSAACRERDCKTRAVLRISVR
jgi:hypothetical protein